MPQNDSGPCYPQPTRVRHVSERDWHSTLLLLFFCLYIQIIVMIMAVLWDFGKESVSTHWPPLH